ncbi:MAG: hypothetical protein ACLT22_08615 [Coprobacillus cateniformis]|uniref:hypothetical protein n=1 Tax=Coprobacillus cateniformis TaxID=100884 RepID=UPI0039908C3D
MKYYCQKCHLIYDQDICLQCGEKLKEAHLDDDCFLIEKKQLWADADMLKELLEEHHVPYYCASLMGAGMSLKIGPMLETYQFYVPYSHYDEALSCVKTLFGADEIEY